MRLVDEHLRSARGLRTRGMVLAERLRDIDPDLLTLQVTIVRDDYDQVRDLLGGRFQLVHQTSREPDGQGSAPPAAGRSPRCGSSTSSSAPAIVVDTPQHQVQASDHFGLMADLQPTAHGARRGYSTR